jgi:hypothetical protein
MKQSRWRISSGRGPFPIWSEPQGVPLLSEATERWHAIGRAGWADAVWSELMTWHMHRGEMNELLR